MISELYRVDVGFPPIFKLDAKLLILGSLPGKRSIAENRYYGHPRNLFWQILSAHIGVAADVEYEVRVQAVLENKIALWDVMASAQRSGSLDSAIERSSVVVNPIADLIAQLPQLNTIILNGTAAMGYFKKAGLIELCNNQGLAVRQLPSSSPAHAALSSEAKLAQWNPVIAEALSVQTTRIPLS